MRRKRIPKKYKPCQPFNTEKQAQTCSKAPLFPQMDIVHFQRPQFSNQMERLYAPHTIIYIWITPSAGKLASKQSQGFQQQKTAAPAKKLRGILEILWPFEQRGALRAYPKIHKRWIWGGKWLWWGRSPLKHQMFQIMEEDFAENWLKKGVGLKKIGKNMDSLEH